MAKTVYINLLNEGSDAYQPTLGEEKWEFIPDSIVKCELQQKN